ncbi:MAG TPA: hypothetical protein VFB79_23835 [Candidatus Angelobacter sp.]|nr:hypothetical protein [Candidatus Angelobacter sp.]
MIELAKKIISHTLQGMDFALSAEELEAGIVGFMLEDLGTGSAERYAPIAAQIRAAIHFEPNRTKILCDVAESNYDDAAVMKNGQNLVDNIVLLLERVQ